MEYWFSYITWHLACAERVSTNFAARYSSLLRFFIVALSFHVFTFNYSARSRADLPLIRSREKTVFQSSVPFVPVISTNDNVTDHRVYTGESVEKVPAEAFRIVADEISRARINASARKSKEPLTERTGEGRRPQEESPISVVRIAM